MELLQIFLTLSTIILRKVWGKVFETSVTMVFFHVTMVFFHVLFFPYCKYLYVTCCTLKWMTHWNETVSKNVVFNSFGTVVPICFNALQYLQYFVEFIWKPTISFAVQTKWIVSIWILLNTGKHWNNWGYQIKMG